MSTTGHYNNDRNNKRDRDEGGGGGGGDGDGGGTSKYAEGPKYLLTIKAANGGAKRIDWKAIDLSDKWRVRHITAWKRSKMYDTDHARWKVKQAEFKKTHCGKESGKERTNKCGTNIGREEGSSPSAIGRPGIGCAGE